MISLTSSFQRRHPHPILTTLAPTNRHRTFASTKFRRTFRRVFSGETVHFKCKRTPPWSFPCRALCRDGVGHVNPTSTSSSSPTLSSSPTPATLPKLRRALPLPSFIFGRRWAHHPVRLIVSFHSVVQSIVSWSFSACTVWVNLHKRSSSLHVWSQAPEPPRPRSLASLSVPAVAHSSSLDAPEHHHDLWSSRQPLPLVRPSSARRRNRWQPPRDPLVVLFPFRASPELLGL
jgi:hypothetical protein